MNTMKHYLRSVAKVNTAQENVEQLYGHLQEDVQEILTNMFDNKRVMHDNRIYESSQLVPLPPLYPLEGEVQIRFKIIFIQKESKNRKERKIIKYLNSLIEAGLLMEAESSDHLFIIAKYYAFQYTDIVNNKISLETDEFDFLK